MLGAEQRDWLLGALASSTATWRLIANPSVVGQTWSERLATSARKALATVKLIASDGNGPDPDQWDGYPAERDLLVDALFASARRNVVILSGDVHVSLALEVRADPFDATSPPVAVEFVTASLTSQNVDDKMHWAPRTESKAVERALIEALPHIRWCELDSNGYMVVDVTPERVVGEWWHVDTVLRPSSGEACSGRWSVAQGAAELLPA
jgi:alkaline phosphatase D